MTLSSHVELYSHSYYLQGCVLGELRDEWCVFKRSGKERIKVLSKCGSPGVAKFTMKNGIGAFEGWHRRRERQWKSGAFLLDSLAL